MNAVEIARQIKDVLTEIANLESQIAGADPTVGFRDARGNWVNRLDYLRKQLTNARNTLANLQKMEAGLAAGTEAAAGTASGGIVTRVLTGVGRAVLRIFGRQAVSGAVALGTGAVVTAVVLGAATYGAANFIGSRSGDASVQAGPAMLGPAATPVGVPGADSAGKFAVFVLTANSGGTIWIGSEETLKTLRACDTPYGGLCDDPSVTYPPVPYNKVSQDFDTFDEAVAALCSATVQHPGYWGNKAEGYGGQYWNDYSCP